MPVHGSRMAGLARVTWVKAEEWLCCVNVGQQSDCE